MENKNPLSPHIQIYRWHISSLISISQRITGVINIVGLIFICFVILYRTQRTWLGTKLPLRYKNVIKIRFKHDEFMALEVNVAKEISFLKLVKTGIQTLYSKIAFKGLTPC